MPQIEPPTFEDAEQALAFLATLGQVHKQTEKRIRRMQFPVTITSAEYGRQWFDIDHVGADLGSKLEAYLATIKSDPRVYMDD